MKCPNCQTDNLPISRFCVKCKKPLRLSREMPSIPEEKSPAARKEPDEKIPTITEPAKKEVKPVLETQKLSVSPKEKPVKKEIRPEPKPGISPQKELDTKEITPAAKTVEKPAPGVQKPGIKTVVKENKPIEVKTDGQVARPARPEDRMDEKPLEKEKGPEIKISPESKPPVKTPKPDSHTFPKPDPGKKKKIKPLLLLGIFLAVVILGIIIWLLFLKGGPEKGAPIPGVPEKPSLAVMYFKNNTGDAELNIWSEALAYALITDLKRSKQIRVLSAERLFLTLNKLNLLESQNYSFRDFQRIASLTGVNHILSGELTHVGGRFHVSSSLWQTVSRKEIFSESFEGEGENSILVQVTALTQLINEALKGSGTQAIESSEEGISDIISINPDVYTNYVQARINHFQHNYRPSIQIMDQVLAVDPGFALAAVSKSESLYALGYLDRSWKESQMAQGLLEKLSERGRFHLQGDFYRKSEKTYDIAIKVYNRLLEVYPWDHIGNTRLGFLYKNLKQWDLAQKCFQVNHTNKVKTENSCLGQALVLTAQGEYAKAEKVLLSYLKLSPGSENIYLHMAALSLLQEKYQDALLAVEKGLSLRPEYCLTRMKGEIFLLTNDLRAAESEFQKLTKSEETIAQLWGIQRLVGLSRLRGKFARAQRQVLEGIQLAENLGEMGWKYRFHMDLARMFLEAGKPQRVLQECEQAWNIAVQGETRGFPREVLLYRGLAYLLMNRGDDAMATGAELKVLCEKGPAADRMRYYLLLNGNIALAKGDFSQAIDQISQAVALLPHQEMPWLFSNDHAYFLNFLAAAQTAAGKSEKALESYERIASLSTGRIGFGAIYARSLYKLGLLFAHGNSQEKAIAYLQMFSTLWQEADPGNPEITDARRRIASLQ